MREHLLKIQNRTGGYADIVQLLDGVGHRELTDPCLDERIHIVNVGHALQRSRETFVPYKIGPPDESQDCVPVCIAARADYDLSITRFVHIPRGDKRVPETLARGHFPVHEYRGEKAAKE